MAKYERPDDADERIESAITVIEALLPLDIQPRMKRKFISNCLWQITQAEGTTKYQIQFRSRAALGATKNEWRHDHVWRRDTMVKALMCKSANVRAILRNAVGCVVTKAEHNHLGRIDKASPSVDGWERYRRAEIEVIDVVTGERLIFPEPVRT